MSSEWKV